MGNQFRNVAVIPCLKTFLFVFNVFFWLLGLVLLAFGLWAEFDMYKYLEMSPEFSGTLPHVAVGLAVLNIAISSIAFSCIIKGQPVLLYLYGGFLACVFIMEVGVPAAVVCYKDTFSKGLHDGLTQSVLTYDPRKTNFDFAQSTMHCCGVYNYTDWVRMSSQRVIPSSCCIDLNRCVTANYSDVYQRGCYEAILQYMESHINIIVAVAVVTACFPLIGTILSCGLATYIKKAKYDVIN